MINTPGKKETELKKLVPKEIQTYFHPISYSYITIFSPKEKNISLCVSLQQDLRYENASDFFVSVSDVNNRCIRKSAKTSNFKEGQLVVSLSLNSAIYEGPFRLEIIHRTENENFRNFRFKIWYMRAESKNVRPGFFARIGKFFPGPSTN